MFLKVVSSMNNNKALISTALLTALFEEKKQDNISLLIAFVIKILYENPSIKEENISDKMIELYSFNKFPHAIVKIIIKRLKNKILLNSKMAN